MGHASDRVKLTYEDLLALPDDGLRHELIDGEHYVTPAPGSAHQLIIGNLYLLLSAFARERAAGVVMLAPFDIVFSPHDVVAPDLITSRPNGSRQWSAGGTHRARHTWRSRCCPHQRAGGTR